MGMSRRALVLLLCVLASPASLASAQELSDAESRATLEHLSSPDPEVRLAAAEVLGRRAQGRRDEVATALRRVVRGDPDWRVRASSIRAVGRLAIRAAVPDLVAALRDPQVEIRVVAAAALWRLPDPAAVPPLVELLSDGDPAARQWAALALGVTGDSRATPHLVRILSDANAEVRMDSLRSLGRIGDPDALAELLGFAADGTRAEDERLEAVGALSALRAPAKVPALLRLCGDPTPAVRLRAVQAVGRVATGAAVAPLRRRQARERDPGVRRAIAEALLALRDRAGGVARPP
jgi:HEAT repeat protein